MLDAISTLNTDVSNLTTSIPSQIKTNNQQTLATVEQNPEAASRAYAAGEYLVTNGKLYKVLNNIAEGAALQDNVNIEWVLLGDEVNKLKNDLKAGAWSDVVNNFDRTTEGGVLDARLGSAIKDSINKTNTSKGHLDNMLGWQLGNFMGMRYVDIPGKDLSQGAVLTKYINPNPGYKFVCWFPFVATSGFVGNVPAYIANPAHPAGGFYCNNINKATNAYYRCIYLQVRNVWGSNG